MIGILIRGENRQKKSIRWWRQKLEFCAYRPRMPRTARQPGTQRRARTDHCSEPPEAPKPAEALPSASGLQNSFIPFEILSMEVAAGSFHTHFDSPILGGLYKIYIPPF